MGPDFSETSHVHPKQSGEYACGQYRSRDPKGTGELPGVAYEEIVYEGYAAGGVRLIIEVTTDNRIAPLRSGHDEQERWQPCWGWRVPVRSEGTVHHRREANRRRSTHGSSAEAGAEDIKNEGITSVICPMSEYDALSELLAKEIETESSDPLIFPTSLGLLKIRML